jgi:cytochrome d ubiquinol oxidase subunit I
VIALISGWVVTEVGRQPWIVYGVMPTDAAVTGAHGIPIGYGALAAAYLIVACGLAWVLRRLARAPLEEPLEPPAKLQAA